MKKTKNNIQLGNLHECKQNSYPSSTCRPTKMCSLYHHSFSEYLSI